MENLAKNFVLSNLKGVSNINLIEQEIKKELSAYTNKILELLINHGAYPKHPVQIEEGKINKNKPFGKLKILCVGESVIDKGQIFNIFNDAFYKQFGEELPKKSLYMPVLEYKKMKTFDFIKQIKTDRYDYIITGPRPHSTANKGINMSLYGLKQTLQLKAIISDFNKDPLNKSALEEIAENFSLHYKQNQ